MTTCLRCGSDCTPGRYCSACGARLQRGLPWYGALLSALAAGLVAFGLGLFGGDDGTNNPHDDRAVIEVAVGLGAVAFAAVVWFCWLRFSLKRRRLRATRS